MGNLAPHLCVLGGTGMSSLCREALEGREMAALGPQAPFLSLLGDFNGKPCTPGGTLQMQMQRGPPKLLAGAGA
jgi:hypothetical protein